MPRGGVQSLEIERGICHGNFPLAALTQCRIAKTPHFEGLQPLRLGRAANAPNSQCDARLPQYLLWGVVVNVVQVQLGRTAPRQDRYLRQMPGQLRRVKAWQGQLELDLLRIVGKIIWFHQMQACRSIMRPEFFISFLAVATTSRVRWPNELGVRAPLPRKRFHATLPSSEIRATT